MTNQELKSIDEYEVHLSEKMTSWSPRQRVAFAATVAERWLPTYESFSTEEEWGDPASIRRSLEAVWGHVQGRSLTVQDVARHLQQVEELTPHMDDFDAEEALAACVIVKETLRSCGTPEGTVTFALGAALSAFEGLYQDWPDDPASQVRVWRKSAVRKEVQAQLTLAAEIDALNAFDTEAVAELRRRVAGQKVKLPARPKSKGPPRLTNQIAFEQYRRYVESDLRGQVTGQAEPVEGSYLFVLTYLAYWMGRYSRRLQTLNGSYGRLADEQGQRAIVTRNQALDLAEKGLPEWGEEARETLEMCLKTNCQINVLDAGSPEALHAYGPSLRRLWLEGKRLGKSDLNGWSFVRAWASHRPEVWEAEDRRKKKGWAHSSLDLGEKLARTLTWISTSDPFQPWKSDVDGASWRIRVNDFPDEIMYSLVIETTNAGDFHDWPETWQRTNVF